MAGTKGCGTLVRHNLSGSMATVPDVVDVTPPASTIPDEIDMTAIDDTEMDYEQGCINDYGELSFTIRYQPANALHQQLVTAFGARTNASWELVYADGSSTDWAFTGQIKSMTPSQINRTTDVQMAFVVRLTSVITFPS